MYPAGLNFTSRVGQAKLAKNSVLGGHGAEAL